MGLQILAPPVVRRGWPSRQPRHQLGWGPVTGSVLGNPEPKEDRDVDISIGAGAGRETVGIFLFGREF